MKRKIIKQGANTLTITLPSEWAKKYNIQAGDEIDITEENKNLIISKENFNNVSKKIEIDITGFDIPRIWKYIMGPYREGYDEILIKYSPEDKLENPYKFLIKQRSNPQQKQEIRPMFRVLQGFIDRFIGFEIIEHGKNFIIAKDMGIATDKEFDNSLRRIFLLLMQMSEDTLDSINKNDSSLVSHINDVDINLDKFHDYCIRVLNKTRNFPPKKSQLLFSIIYFLELIGDEFKNISLHLKNDFADSNYQNLLETAKNIDEQIKEFYSLFYKFNQNKVENFSKIDEKMYLSFPSNYKGANEYEKEILHHFRIIQRYLNALLELRIELNFSDI